MREKHRFFIRNKLLGHGPNFRVFIIAEAGVNHNQKLDLALDLIDAAANAGADAVKFQTAHAEQVVTKFGEMADYQKKNTGTSESQLEMIRKLLPPDDWYPRLIEHCEDRNIIFLSTPHGSFASVDLLLNLGVPAFKFGSGDLTNLPLLEYAANFEKPMILGTGMATMSEVKEAVDTIQKTGNHKIVVLHCTTNYPCALDEVNLRAMQSMMEELDVSVGYSDHTTTLEVPVMATTLGACVIEKHLTLDNNLPGPDHKASITPKIFKEMVNEIRDIELIMGSEIKKPSYGELKYIPLVRKSIVATKDIKRGEIFSLENIDLKRPGTGMHPRHFYRVIGHTAKISIENDTLLTEDMIA